jgi:hypothetical protein
MIAAAEPPVVVGGRDAAWSDARQALDGPIPSRIFAEFIMERHKPRAAISCYGRGSDIANSEEYLNGKPVWAKTAQARGGGGHMPKRCRQTER